MGASQRELKAAPRGQGPPAAFNAEGGFVVHPLLRPATVAAREQDLEAAARAVETASLVVVRRSTDAWPLTLLVAAERLRQAGGFALVVASTASAVKQRAQAFRRALTDEAADRVEGVSAGTAKAERERAFERAWVVVSTPEVAAHETEGGRLALGRCCLLVVEDADRAVASVAHAEIVRALRRDRPRALMFGVAASRGNDRRRWAAAAEALGVRRIDDRTGAGGDAQAPQAQTGPEVLEVELPPALGEIQALLESQLEHRLRVLRRLGALAEAPVRAVGRRALREAGAQLRNVGSPSGTALTEGARALFQAEALVFALETLEEYGAPALARHLGDLGASAMSPAADRAVAALPAVRQAHARAKAEEAEPPKVQALTAALRSLFNARPGAQAGLLIADRREALRLKDRLARAPPLGPGLRCTLVGSSDPMPSPAHAQVVIASGSAAESVDYAGLDLVAVYDAASWRARPAALMRLPRGPRVVLFVSPDARAETEVAHGSGRRARGASAARGPHQTQLPGAQPARGGRP